MSLKINPTTFPQYIQGISYKEHGDRYERELGSFLSTNFPNCEMFWRIFIVPFTKRIEGYPEQIIQSKDVRQGIHPEIEDVANAHYSMFMNLIFAHRHLETRMLSSFENIYTHLGSACDLAEMALEKWYFLFLKCQGKKTKVLEKLSRDEFLEKAGKWFDEKYPRLYKYYLARGKNPPFDLISGEDILVEYLGKKSTSRKTYITHSLNIRQFRNVIVHDVKVARIIDDSSEHALIPKPNVIGKYRSWRNVLAAIQDKELLEMDFAEQYLQAKEDLDALECALNNVWETMINDFRAEFFSADRITLRNMYNIEFSTEGPVIVGINHDVPNAPYKYPPVQPSGVYTDEYDENIDAKGTAIYHIPRIPVSKKRAT